MLAKMVRIAASAHSMQTDLQGEPYILHCMRVMDGLDTNDEELKCIAIGHDLFEDTTVTVEYLSAVGISQRVIDGIRAMTKSAGQDYHTYLNQVIENDDAILVKMSDIRDNSRVERQIGIKQKDLDRISKYHIAYHKLSAVAKERGLI